MYPDIKRTVRYDKESRNYVPGDKIVIGNRIPDPAGGRADFDEILKLTPDEARYVATELWSIAEKIDGKLEKTSKMKQIRKHTEKIIKSAKAEAMK